MQRPYDVVIVGGAVVGSATAYFLAADPAFGGRVLIVERDLGYGRSATARSVASIRHQFSTPENIRMSVFGTEFVRRAAGLLALPGEMPPDLGFQEGGYLFLAGAAGAAALAGNVALQQREGAQVALLDREALARRFAWLRCDDLAAGALGTAGEGWLDAHALMVALRRKAQSLGVQVLEGEAVALRREGGRVTGVQLADGSAIGAGCVVNAAGTGAAALAATAGIALQVQPRKRCVFFFRTPSEVAPCPLVVDPSGMYFRPEGRGFLCGIAPPAHADPPSGDLDVDHALFDDVLWPLLAARAPGFQALKLVSAWAGHYDVHLLDHNPVIGAHPQLDGLLFANGFSGHGLQHAPAVGRALAELIVHGRYRTLDLSRLGWQRVLDGTPLAEANVV